jgi:hypothetical protein
MKPRINTRQHEAEFSYSAFFRLFSGLNLYFFALAPVFFGGLMFVKAASAQDYPKEIRGYKIYKTKISVKNADERKDLKDNSTEAFVKVSEPTVADVSLTGVTLEASAEIAALTQSGKVDFLTFKDFLVNGLKVDIEEYREPFSFEKNQTTLLPKPVKIFLGTGQTILGAISEARDSKDEWTVTGTVFVFGKFKKMGFNFKRVVPVEVSIKIKNPLKTIDKTP